MESSCRWTRILILLTLSSSVDGENPPTAIVARPMQANSSFLQKFPLEIRLAIYRYVAGEISPAPITVQSEACRGFVQATFTPTMMACGFVGPERHVQQLSGRLRRLHYALKSGTPRSRLGQWSFVMGRTSCAGLYFACRQIREELAMIDRRVDGWTYIHLDLSAENLYPRWLHVSDGKTGPRSLQSTPPMKWILKVRVHLAKRLLMSRTSELDRRGWVLCWTESRVMLDRQRRQYLEHTRRAGSTLDDGVFGDVQNLNKAFQRLRVVY